MPLYFGLKTIRPQFPRPEISSAQFPALPECVHCHSGTRVHTCTHATFVSRNINETASNTRVKGCKTAASSKNFHVFFCDSFFLLFLSDFSFFFCVCVFDRTREFDSSRNHEVYLGLPGPWIGQKIFGTEGCLRVFGFFLRLECVPGFLF